jgi:hypothetical protein
MLTVHNAQSHHAECRCAGCRVFIVMLNVVAPKNFPRGAFTLAKCGRITRATATANIA